MTGDKWNDFRNYPLHWTDTINSPSLDSNLCY